MKQIQRFALVLAGLLLALCWSAGGASANTGRGQTALPNLQVQDQSNRNKTDQDADSRAAAIQVGGVNAPISVLNLGHSYQGGQSNSAVNSASSSNENGTGQANVGSQESGSGWSPAPAVQVQDQSNRNKTDQDADSRAAAIQAGGVNAPISVANLGCLQQGGQSNTAVNTASATNQNHTLQLNALGQMLR